MNDLALKVDNLTRKFGKFTAVDNLNFTVKKGEIFGFLGANGAGKTTAMKMLTGLLKPTSGNAVVAGFDLFKDAEKIKRRIGYMSQKFTLYEDLTVEENIRFYAGIYGLSSSAIRSETGKLLKKLNLESERRKLIGSLPLGWKQKLAFSVAVIHNPEVVFLDEPTSGVDPITRRQFWSLIYEAAGKGVTVFVTTHYMDEAEYCDRISMMVDGRLKALDTPQVLKQQYEVNSMNEVFLKMARPQNQSA